MNGAQKVMNGLHVVPSRGSRGVALISALFIVVVLLILTGSLLDLMPQELRSVAYSSYDNRALYVADAGVENYVRAIEEALPGTYCTTLNYQFAPEPDGSQAHFSVNCRDFQVVNGLQSYYVTSTGYSPQGTDRKIDAVITEVAFSIYDYFSVENESGNWWVSGLSQFNGPVYLQGNSQNPVNFQFFDGRSSIGLDKMTVVNNVHWYQNQPPASNPDWLSMDASGQAGMSFTNTPVNFPPDVASILIANQAYNGTNGSGSFPAPSGAGVYMNGANVASASGGTLNSGIFVNGSANVSFSSTSTTQTITFAPPSGGCSGANPIPNTVTATVNYSTNQTTVVTGSHNATYSGVPSGQPASGSGANGALFVDGTACNVAGTVHGQFTLAVPDTTNVTDDIHLFGNLTYQNDPQTCNCSSTDVLGMYAHNVDVDWGAGNNLTIEAAIFAGNSHDVSSNDGQGSFKPNFDIYSKPLTGYLHVFGSTVQNQTVALGVYNQGCGCMVHAYNDSYFYDSRFKDLTPPYYPRTGLYRIIVFKDEGI